MPESDEAPIEGQEESALDRLPDNLSDAFSEDNTPVVDGTPEATQTPDPTDDADDAPPAESGDAPDPSPVVDELHQRQLAVIERLERLANAKENAENRLANDPTEQNRRAVAKVDRLINQEKSALQKIGEADDLDLEPGKHIKTVASEFEGYQRQQGETQAQYDQRLARLEQQNAYLIEQSVRRDFESQHPGLKYDEVVQQARQRINAMFEGVQEQVPASLYEKLVRQQWQATVEEAKAKVPAPATPKPDTPPVKTPKHTQPIQSSTGSSQRAAPTKKPGLSYDLLPDSLSGGWD